MIINIVFAIDINYLLPTCIAIESILMHADIADTYNIYVIEDKVAADAGRECFDLLESQYSNCQICILEVKIDIDDKALCVGHISSAAAFYRLMIPNLVRAEKCLYMDSDVVVCENIADMYHTDLGDNLVGGVYAPSYHLLPDGGKDYIDRTGIPALDQYINAGVLLMNLKRMRECHFTEEGMELVNCNFPSMDQDIINRLCYDRIAVLPLKYNLQTKYNSWHKEKWAEVFSEQEIDEAMEKPCIIHYTMPQKPWTFPDFNYSSVWWEVSRKSLFKDQIDEQYKETIFYYENYVKGELADICSKSKYSSDWVEAVKKREKVYIYGGGIVGHRLLRFFQRNNIFVKAFLVTSKTTDIDKDSGLNIEEFHNTIEKDALIFIATNKFFVAIREKLFFNGYYNILNASDYEERIKSNNLNHREGTFPDACIATNGSKSTNGETYSVLEENFGS